MKVADKSSASLEKAAPANFIVPGREEKDVCCNGKIKLVSCEVVQFL